MTISLALFVFAGAGCSKSDKPELSTATPQPSASASQSSASSPAAKEAAGDGAFACTLLTREETEAVQGEPFKETKASQKTTAGLTTSQCYFELPTTVNSIVLTVTQRAEGADARDPKQNWQELFHRDKAAEKKEEEKEGGQGPEKIDGLGDEAFWTGSRVGGALYVLNGNSFIRISVGGAGDRAEKIEKSKALAQSVLKRL
ncbi:MAG TPA: hypothetical protein VEX43_12480 [Chthoniobacterales bacterium]|nr:hypothetical protein [Chthoniobacterales bacterium]